MNKKISIIAGIIIIASIIGIASIFSYDQTNNIFDGEIKKDHDYVWSGPLGVTQYEHRLGEDVFLVMRGLQPNERGTVEIFTPPGILFKSFEYDGSLKSDFNFYFYPDTSVFSKICTPEELVGIWKIVFTNNAYPTLEFKMSDEYLPGGEAGVKTEC